MDHTDCFPHVSRQLVSPVKSGLETEAVLTRNDCSPESDDCNKRKNAIYKVVQIIILSINCFLSAWWMKELVKHFVVFHLNDLNKITVNLL